MSKGVYKDIKWRNDGTGLSDASYLPDGVVVHDGGYRPPIKGAKAGQQQQRQQEEQNQRQIQEDAMRRNPQYACVNGRDIYGHIGDAACGGGQPTNTRPVPPKPSSYGAVAWSIQNRKLGISSRQATKQASISAAMKQCGDATCVVSATYSNSCIAL